MVKFDKLHKSLTNDEYVPVIGDLMTSRWAFEALAVNQFMNNRYEKTYFPYEQLISNADYLVSYMIPALRSKLDESWQEIQGNNAPDQQAPVLELIDREVASLVLSYPGIPLEASGPLDSQSLDEERYQEYKTYFVNLTNHLRSQIRELNRLKNQVTEKMIEEAGGLIAFTEFKNAYENTKLTEMMHNRSELVKILDKNQKLIRKIEPIYMAPTSKIGRAQLYAPYKQIGNFQIDTLWFNVMIIWLSSLFLYVTLYVDLLRRILTFTGNLRWKKLS
jgi:hypothetical protein